jgi:hypothetical protein
MATGKGCSPEEWAHVEALDPDAGCWTRRFAQLSHGRSKRTVIVDAEHPLRLV